MATAKLGYAYFQFRALWRQIAQAGRVAASGIFDADAYIDLNPDYDLPKHRALIHWIRYGLKEGRLVNASPLRTWLLEKLTAFEITPSTARTLADALGPEIETRIEARKELDIHEYLFIKSYMNANFEDAIFHLSKTRGAFYLRMLHKSLRRMPDIPNLAEHYANLEKSGLKKSFQQNPGLLVQWRDVSVAAGVAWPAIAQLNKQIVEAYSRGGSKLDAFNSGVFPVTPPHDADFRANFSSFEQYYGAFAAFQDIAAVNAARECDFISVSGTIDRLQRRPAKDDAILVYVPEPTHWVSTTLAQITIKEAFKGIIAYLLAQDKAVVPMPAPHTRNLTVLSVPFNKVVSYHTYARRRDDIIHYKEGNVRGYAVIDRSGYSGAAALARGAPVPIAPSNTNASEFVERYMKDDLSKYVQVGEADEALPTSYVFVPLQVYDDSASRWHRVSPIILLEQVFSHYDGSDVSVVVKPHPLDTSPAISRRLAQYADASGLYVSHAPIKTLLEGARIVFTANSGVGFEALLFGKPVVMSGDGDYAAAVHKFDGREPLRDVISRVEAEAPDARRRRIDRFLDYYFNAYAFDVHKTLENPTLLDATALSMFLE